MADAWLNLERMEGISEARRGTRLKSGVRAGRQAIMMARFTSRATGGIVSLVLLDESLFGGEGGGFAELSEGDGWRW